MSTLRHRREVSITADALVLKAPWGALPVGSSLSVETITVPAEARQSGVPVEVFDVSAVDKSGDEITRLTVPLELRLPTPDVDCPQPDLPTEATAQVHRRPPRTAFRHGGGAHIAYR